MSAEPAAVSGQPTLKRSLRYWDLVLYGLILVQPTAPMPVFGVIYKQSDGFAVSAVLCALVAMLFTSISYGRMSRRYTEGGSAYTYLPASVKRFPPADGLAALLRESGFGGVSYRLLAGSIVALHSGAAE